MTTNPTCPALWLPTETGEGATLVLLPEGTTRADLAAELDGAQTAMADHDIEEDYLPEFVLVVETAEGIWVDQTAEPVGLEVDEVIDAMDLDEAREILAGWVEATLA